MQLYLTPKRIFSIKRIIKLETKPKIIIIEALSLELNKHINVTTYLFKEIRFTIKIAEICVYSTRISVFLS